LEQPLKVKKPSRIGVDFNGDTFDADVHPDWQDDILEVIEKCKWHTFVLLTKQPQNIPKWFDYETPNNLWLGVSVNCIKDLWRIVELRKTFAPVKFVSFEPLYEDLSFVDLQGIDWVIIGAQTRPNLQPRSEWVDSLALNAGKNGIPVFMKNNLPNHCTQQLPKIAGGLE
jgi:protein gp37